MAPMCLPWTTLDRIDEFVLNTIYHVFSLLCALIAYILFDTLFLLQIMHVILLTSILVRKIRHTNCMIRNKSPELEVKINIRNMVLLHNEMLRCISRSFAQICHELISTYLQLCGKFAEYLLHSNFIGRHTGHRQHWKENICIDYGK